MKNKGIITIGIVILTAVFGIVCQRSEPHSLSADPPGLIQLQPLAHYYIGTHVAEPSGIVYYPKNNSLLVVSDSHPEVYEIDFQGRLLHALTTTSSDLEGIALSNTGDTIYIVEEKNRTVVSYNTAGTKLSSFKADVATLPNNALEGITVGRNGELYVLNEKSPGMVLQYSPDSTERRRTVLTQALDYSDIFYDSGEDCWWIISDESKKIMKMTKNGSLLAQWGLPFSKGEGIAIVRDTMYVVNDADATLYLFRKP